MLFRLLLVLACVGLVPEIAYGQGLGLRILNAISSEIDNSQPQYQPQQQYRPQQYQPQQQYRPQQQYQPQQYQPQQYQPQQYRPQNTQQQGATFNRVSNGWASANTYSGRNQQTGGYNTQNTHYQDSAFVAGREEGKANSRFERNNVYDSRGNVVGFQEGQVWNNAQTGQRHHKMKTYTPNNSGGVQKTSSFGLTGN